MITRHYNPEINDGNDFHLKADFKMEMCYFNRSTTDITVVGRDNLPLILPKLSGNSSGYRDIIIRRSYTFSSYHRITELISTLNDIYAKNREFPSEDVRLIYGALQKQPPNNRNANIAIVRIDRRVDVDDIVKHDSLYSVDLDIMLYHGVANHTMIHPYSQKALSQEDTRDIIKQLPRELAGLTIQVVDNDNIISNQYAYCLGEIMDIPVIQDSTRDNGLYISHIRNDEVTTHKHDLSQTNDYGIYSTKEDARTNGKPDLVHQREVTELKRHLERETLLNKQKQQELQSEIDERRKESESEAENRKRENDKYRYEQELLADERKRKHEEEINRLKIRYEEDMRKLEQERHETKDKYDARSYERKDSAETLKTFGVLLATGLSIFAIVQKSK